MLGPQPLVGMGAERLTANVNISQHWVGMQSSINNWYAKSFGTAVTHHTVNIVIYGNYNIGKCNIFHKPNEAMLFVTVKTCLHLQNILLFRILKYYIYYNLI